MPLLLTIVISIAAVAFLTVIPLVACRVQGLTSEQLQQRMEVVRLPGWQRRLFLAGVGWGIAGLAMASGVLLALASASTGSRSLGLIAAAVLVVWIVFSLASVVASLIGRPRILLLPQIRDRDWAELTERRTSSKGTL